MELPDFGGELRWTLIQNALDEFRAFLSPTVPKLTIEPSEDVLDWKAKAGVYLQFDREKRLLYIGLTMEGFAKRKAAHKRRVAPLILELIVFEQEFSFFAAALEVFLHQRLSPALSDFGKHV